MEKSKLIDNTLEAAAAAQPAQASAVDTALHGDAGASANSSSLLDGFGHGAVLEEAKPKKRKAAPSTAQPATGPTINRSTASAMKTVVSAAEGQGQGAGLPTPVMDADCGSSKRTKKQKEQDELRSRMDLEMQKVADLHLQNGKGSSVKCLPALRVQTFMQTALDNSQGQILPAACALFASSAQMSRVRNDRLNRHGA